MDDTANLFVEIAVVVAALVILSSIPSWLTIFRCWGTVKSVAQSGYQDEDGEARDETPMAASHRWQRAAIVGFSLIGLSTALGDVLLALIQRDSVLIPMWLHVGDWVRFRRNIGMIANQMLTVMK
jgi:hypothetical protein